MKEPDARSLGLWLISTFVVVMVNRTPVVHLMVIAIAWLVAQRGDDKRPFHMLVAIGSSALVLRTLLFALAAGGNDVSAVIVAGATEGIRFTAILACFGAFLCLTSSTALIRMLPRSMFEAALVLNIAMVFAPQLLRTARDIKDAGRTRGLRGIQLVRSSVMPLLSTALERSIALAESMDSRGFGKKTDRLPAWIGPSIAISAALTMSAVSLWLMGTAQTATATAAILGGGLVLALMRKAGSWNGRTVYRRSRPDRADRLVAGCAFAVGLSAALIAAAGGLRSSSLIPPVGATFITMLLVIPAIAIRRPA